MGVSKLLRALSRPMPEPCLLVALLLLLLIQLMVLRELCGPVLLLVVLPVLKRAMAPPLLAARGSAGGRMAC